MYDTIDEARFHAARGAQLHRMPVHIIACGTGFELTATPAEGVAIIESAPFPAPAGDG